METSECPSECQLWMWIPLRMETTVWWKHQNVNSACGYHWEWRPQCLNSWGGNHRISECGAHRNFIMCVKTTISNMNVEITEFNALMYMWTPLFWSGNHNSMDIRVTTTLWKTSWWKKMWGTDQFGHWHQLCIRPIILKLDGVEIHPLRIMTNYHSWRKIWLLIRMDRISTVRNPSRQRPEWMRRLAIPIEDGSLKDWLLWWWLIIVMLWWWRYLVPVDVVSIAIHESIVPAEVAPQD